MNTINVSFTAARETLLLTLYTRAMDSRAKRPTLGDKKAEEIVKEQKEGDRTQANLRNQGIFPQPLSSDLQHFAHARQ